MTQIEIAKSIGKSQAHISLIISGKRNPSWLTALKLAEITGTEPSDWMEPDQDRSKLLKNDFVLM